MKQNRRRVCPCPVAVLPLLVSLQAVVADPACPDPAVPAAAILMPPPKPDSAHTKAELQELLRLQEARTPKQVEHVKGDDHRTVQRFLGGMGIKVEDLSDTATRIFDCIVAAVEHDVREAKKTNIRQ